VALLVPPPLIGEVGADVGENELVVTMYGSDVILSDVKNGQVVALISCGEGEVRVSARLLFLFAPSLVLVNHLPYTHARVEAGG